MSFLVLFGFHAFFVSTSTIQYLIIQDIPELIQGFEILSTNSIQVYLQLEAKTARNAYVTRIPLLIGCINASILLFETEIR